MWLVAWTLNHGHNDMPDFWMVHETEAEARDQYRRIVESETHLHCAAVCKIEDSTEHWHTA